MPPRIQSIVMFCLLICNQAFGLAPVHQALDKQHMAVILLDMQEIYVEGIKEKDALIKNQIALIRWCAAEDIPLIVLEVPGRGKTLPCLLEEIARVPRTRTLEKEYNDGFSNKELDLQLKEYGAKAILLTGINADLCIKDTVKGGMSQGYDLLISPVLISGRPHQSQDNSLSYFREIASIFPDLDSIFKVAA